MKSAAIRLLTGFFLLPATGVVLFFTSHLDDFDFDNTIQQELTFESQGNTLSGTLLLPGSGQPAAVAIIIHGDGPQDRYSDMGYSPLFNTLTDAGIAVFSWDKAGVGSSQETGWINQCLIAQKKPQPHCALFSPAIRKTLFRSVSRIFPGRMGYPCGGRTITSGILCHYRRSS